MNGYSSFHFEINSFEEFACFVMLIRHEDLTDDKLREMAARLQKSTTALANAEQADAAKS